MLFRLRAEQLFYDKIYGGDDGVAVLYAVRRAGTFCRMRSDEYPDGVRSVGRCIRSLATLIGALGTYVLRKYKWLAIVPPILSNTLILPFVFKYVYGDGTIRYLMLSVGVGEIVSCGILGTLLTVLLSKYKNQLKL